MTEDFPKIDELDYRGFHIDFLADDCGQQVVAEFESQPISFGTYNLEYKDEMKYIIDRKLDTISDKLDVFGARLEYFDNGGFRDARLVYRQRTVEIYLLAKEYTEEERAKIEQDMIDNSNRLLKELLCEDFTFEQFTKCSNRCIIE